MFTGIIGTLGRFQRYGRGQAELIVEAPGAAGRSEIGGSVAVDGVCLSVVRQDGSNLVFNLSGETRARTTLGLLRPGAVLNLEWPLTLAAPLNGHLVSGHVDYVATVKRVVPKRPGRRLVLSLPAEFRPFFVVKGSAAVNGVSLTVAALGPSAFEVELIPVTLETSNLAALRAGAAVNVECDMFGKYVYNWASQRSR